MEVEACSAMDDEVLMKQATVLVGVRTFPI